MDFMSEFKLTEDEICDIERRFCKFYLKFVKDYFNLDKNFIWRAKEITNRRTYKKKNDYVVQQPHELLLLCIQDTCLGLRKFYSSVMKYKEITKYLSTKNPLVIYCVIGESVLAALGICIMIDEAVGKYRRLTTLAETKKRIHLIVTEKTQNLRSIFSYIVERVNSCYNNVKLKLVLFEEFSERLLPDVGHRIKEADIVVMSRYLSRFEYLSMKPLLLELILTRMKELSILFFLDACQKRYQHIVKKIFTNVDSLIEIRSKKTAFPLLQNPRNVDIFSKIPFLYNESFQKVMYSVCIKCSGVSYDKGTNDAALLLKHSRKQKRKISERSAKANSNISQLNTASQVNSFVNKKNSEVFKRKKSVENSLSKKLERNNKYLKVKKPKGKTVKPRKVTKTSKCLDVDEPILDYATFLGEIYYSKYFDKEIPGSSKIKSNKLLKK